MGLKVIVIGMGEIGKAVEEVFSDWYPDIEGRDIYPEPPYKVDVMHICYPYKDFNNITLNYMRDYRPDLVIVHTTTPVGTISFLEKSLWNIELKCKVVHIPILGDHSHMVECIRNYKLFIGFDDIDSLNKTADYLKETDLRFGAFPSIRTTELIKLLSLMQYGVNIEFARYAKQCCDKFGVPYEALKTYIRSLNDTVMRMEGIDHVQMVLDPPEGAIGGHCVLPGMEILNDQVSSKYIQEILDLNRSLSSKNCVTSR